MVEPRIITKFSLRELSLVDDSAMQVVGKAFDKATDPVVEPGTGTKRRNIMREFRMTEVSAVDRPAQEGAVATIMKKAQDEPEGIDQSRTPPDPENRASDALRPPRDPIRTEPKEAAMNPVMKAMQSVNEEIQKRKAAVASWQGRVMEIAKRDGCSRTLAAEKLRKEDPAGFEAFQTAA